MIIGTVNEKQFTALILDIKLLFQFNASDKYFSELVLADIFIGKRCIDTFY
jgi:hypothetical protein